MGQTTPFSGAPRGSDAGHVADKASVRETVQNAADEARRAASATSEGIREGAEELSKTARDYAARGRDAVLEELNERKDLGADYISGVAEVLRRVAVEVDQQMPFAASYIRTAAGQVDDVADGVRSGDASQFVREAQRFAREQPTLVAGMAMLAGFAVVRLVRNANAAGPQTDLASSSGSRGRT